MYTQEQQESGFSSSRAEATLFEQAQAGCRESVNQLMEQHERLVRYAVNRQLLFDFPFEEGVQAGRYGLWRAILRYDPQRGTAFSTYAYPAIVHEIWRAVKAHCEQNRQAHATVELQLFFRGWEPDWLQRQEEAAIYEAVHALVGRLPEWLRGVIVAYYGLEGQSSQVYREIGAQLGVTKQRVQQLHVEALVWLRHPAHSQELRSLLQRHSQREYEWANELAQAWLRRRGGRNGHHSVC
jgi:RNA polymerase sigma factor (sigma-70 family)